MQWKTHEEWGGVGVGVGQREGNMSQLEDDGRLGRINR